MNKTRQHNITQDMKMTKERQDDAYKGEGEGKGESEGEGEGKGECKGEGDSEGECGVSLV